MLSRPPEVLFMLTILLQPKPGEVLANGMGVEALAKLEEAYKEHCENVLDLVRDYGTSLVFGYECAIKWINLYHKVKLALHSFVEYSIFVSYIIFLELFFRNWSLYIF